MKKMMKKSKSLAKKAKRMLKKSKSMAKKAKKSMSKKYLGLKGEDKGSHPRSGR